MKDVSNEYHGYLCDCQECTPRVPADRDSHVLKGFPFGILIGIMGWALIGGTIIHFAT